MKLYINSKKMNTQKSENTIRHIVNKSGRKASAVWMEEVMDEDNLCYAEVILRGTVSERESKKLESKIKRALCNSALEWNIYVR